MVEILSFFMAFCRDIYGLSFLVWKGKDRTHRNFVFRLAFHVSKTRLDFGSVEVFSLRFHYKFPAYFFIFIKILLSFGAIYAVL